MAPSPNKQKPEIENRAIKTSPKIKQNQNRNIKQTPVEPTVNAPQAIDKQKQNANPSPRPKPKPRAAQKALRLPVSICKIAIWKC